jgi:hypothetical protein
MNAILVYHFPIKIKIYFSGKNIFFADAASVYNGLMNLLRFQPPFQAAG